MGPLSTHNHVRICIFNLFSSISVIISFRNDNFLTQISKYGLCFIDSLLFINQDHEESKII